MFIFNVNFNVFFKLIKVHLLVSERYMCQNARCNNKDCHCMFTQGVTYLHNQIVTDRLLDSNYAL